tara:strand:+ start:11269 stop:12282 length:1014 start_codon:yes stop_codon:yes gene_type:complete
MNNINKLFYYWLTSSFVLVFLMVVVGGLTRLTDSGLSITEWELFSGIFPPLNKFEWDQYFALYKKIPQYKLLNYDMTLDEFKIIYYWEYFHRILGRIIGLFFLIPLILFYFTNKINKKYLSICTSIFILILIQGLVGWYMVKSGLTQNVSVSHYRLSLHLSIAFIIIGLIYWTIINVKKNTTISLLYKKRYNYFFYVLIFLVLTQIILGAFVSGLDAGKIYQTWPLMDLTFFPSDVKVSKTLDLFNFNNHSLVQFYHRNIAYFLTFYILALGFFILNKKIYNLYKPFLYLFIFLIIQILLGIFTLTSGLNIFLASAHQICSLLLMLSVINLYYYYLK